MKYIFIILVFSLAIGNASSSVTDSIKNSLLFMTVSTTNNKTMAIVLHDFIDINVWLYPELNYAALYDDIKLAKYAINKVKDEYWGTVSGNLHDNYDNPNLVLTSLLISTSLDATNVLRMLLADPRLKLNQDDLYFLLRVAASGNARDNLTILMKAGADINFNKPKANVFLAALISENPDFAKDLINYGFNFCDADGKTRIFKDRLGNPYTYKSYALKHGYTEIYNLIPDCR